MCNMSDLNRTISETVSNNNMLMLHTDTVDNEKHFVSSEPIMYDAQKIINRDIKCCSVDSIAVLIPELKNLQLSSEIKEANDSECLAGYIKAIIPPTGTVIIQLAEGSEILDVGTVIFIKDNNDGDLREIGFITDIFGSVNEPMYTMELKKQIASHLLILDAPAFYLHNHQSTKYVAVKRQTDDTYIVMENQRLCKS